MYAPPPPVAVATQKRNIWPLAGTCCLGLVLFLIASTIILALIPVYLPHKQVNINNNNKDNNNLFYVQYNSVGNGNTSLTGTMNNSQNLAQIEQHINQGMVSSNEGVTIINGSSQTTFFRRRRNLLFRRMKREVNTEVVFTCQYKFKQDCISDNCQTSAKTRINNAIAQMNTLSNIPVNIVNREFGNRSVPLTLTFVRIFTQKPDSLGIEPSTLDQFTAVQSGQFTDSSTWTDGIVPYGQCNIIIPPNIQVTLAKSLVDLNIRRCDINGTLVLGSSVNQSVDFVYPINLIVYPYGTLQDNTEGHVFNLPEGSIITVYPNGTFNGDGTVVNTATKSSSQSRKKRGILLPSGAGPRTCGILPGGATQIFNKVTLIAAASADFTLGSTWLGGVAPTAAGCVLAGGSGLSISSGYSLATAGLSGQLNMNFNYISILAGATFRLGTPNSAAGFKFIFPLRLDCYGILADVTGGKGGIYLPVGSAFNFFAGGSFSSLVATSLIIYDPATGIITSRYALSASFSGPFYMTISLTGSITTSTQTPGDAGSAVGSTVSGGGSTISGGGSTVSGGGSTVSGGGSTVSGGGSTVSGGGSTVSGGGSTVSGGGSTVSGGGSTVSGGGSTVSGGGSTVSGGGSTVSGGGSTVSGGGSTVSGGGSTVSGGGSTVSGTTSATEPEGGATGEIGGSTSTATAQAGETTTTVGGETGEIGGQTGQTTTPGSGQTGESTTPGNGQTGGNTTAGSGQTGGSTSPGSGQTGGSTTPGSGQTGGSTTPGSGQTGESTTPGSGQTGGSTTAGSGQTGGSTSPGSGQTGGSTTPGSGQTGGSTTPGSGQTGETTTPGNGQTGGNTTAGSGQTGGSTTPGSGQTGETTTPGNGQTGGNTTAGSGQTGGSTSPGSGQTGGSTTPGSGQTGGSTTPGSGQTGGSTTPGSGQTEGSTTPGSGQTGGTTAPSTPTCNVIQTGDFNEAATWSGGQVPSGNCSITIPSGKSVTFTGELFNISVPTLTIAGTFVISSTANFTFQYTINIIVKGNGVLQDQSANHKWYFLAGSLCTFYPGASFGGSGTIVYTYTSLTGSGSVGASYTFGNGFSGPFTFAILLSGEIETYTSVTFIVAASGDFNIAGTWLGGIVPTASLCSLVGGCGLYISSGFALTTASLNGELNINFNVITIVSDATFSLGSDTLSGGFRFEFPFMFEIFGTLDFLPSAGGSIYLPFGCAFNFYANAHFESVVMITLRIYNVLIDDEGTILISIDSTFTGPYFVSISLSGEIKESSQPATLAPTTTTSTAGGGLTGGSTTPGNGQTGGSTSSGSGQTGETTTPGNGQTGGNTTAGSGQTGGSTSPGSGQTGGSTTPGSGQTGGSTTPGSGQTGGSTTPGSGQTGGSTTPGSGQTGGSTTPGSGQTGGTTAPSTPTCNVIQTGDFNEAATWSGGQVPSGNCSITIPSGKIVTFTGELFNISVPTLIIAGTFVISSTANFTFQYTINIIVKGNGVLQDQSANHKWYFLAGSLCTFYPGASFTGSTTVVYAYTSLPGSGSAGASYTFGTGFSGPFTFGILLSGEIETYTSVTFIVAASGDFDIAGTWLGGIVPTASLCSLVGGCGLYISSGFVLTTASLNGELNINFNVITIVSNATFSLGSDTLSGGFRFQFLFMFEIFGTLDFLPSAGGSIYLPFGCAFNFYANAHFESVVMITLRIYNVLIDDEGTILISIDSTFTGPYFVSISLSGEIKESSQPATLAPTTTTSTAGGGLTGGSTTPGNGQTGGSTSSGSGQTGATTTPGNGQTGGTTTPGSGQTGGTTAPSTPTCNVIQNGDFNEAATWSGGQVPSGNCSITIPSGKIVTFTGELFNISVPTLTIAGTFIISSTANFTFQYTINIIVQGSGVLQDQSANHKWYFLAGSLCTFYPTAFFIGSSTVVYVYTSLPASDSVGARYTFGTRFSGPFTFAILLSGEIETYTSVTFIVAASGDFNIPGTWFGAMIPTASLCSLVGGCGLYIPTGCSLSTASLNGELDIDFSSITVASGATFDLGTSGLSLGFRFSFSFGFYVYGSLSFSASGGGIYLPFGSAFNFFAGGHFTNSAAVDIRTYDVSVGGIGTVIASLSSSFNGTLYVSVSTDGQQTHTSGAATPILPTTTSSSSSSSFTASRTGSFNDSTIWVGGQIPSGNCSITIPSGVSVIFSGEILNIQVQTLTIAGAFIVSSTTSFTFQYAINILVQAGGKLNDLSFSHQWYFRAGSICTFHPLSSFTGSGTIVYAYTSLPANASPGDRYTFGSMFSGPFTFAVLSAGQIETFDNVQFIVAASGDFSDASTWFGGMVPTADFCSLVGGCGLYIPTGFSLSTASLNGELDIDFSSITVASGATFDLGTSGLSLGFRFSFSFGFYVYGSLSFSASGGGIYLPFGSAFNFFAGGHFTNSAAVDIRTYDVSVGGIGTVIASLSSSFNGTLYVSVSTDGQQTHTSGAATPILPTTTSSSSSSSFTASRTGSFNDSTIWVGGQIPSGNCSITIPSGVSVIFSGEILNIQVQTLTIAGAFIVSSTTSFTFQYAINILVQAGGKLNDLSFSHQWYFRAGSICTFHPLSSFTGSGTIVYAYTSLPANASPGDRYTFGSMFSGPFTFAVLSAGQIETFDNVQFIVAASGDFSDASTWFGGMVPTADFCSLVGGCGLYIPTGFSLSTASLNGELDIDFSSITVASGATFDLGTSGLSLGFRFSFSFGFYVYGSLSFSASGGGIYLPFGSAFNFFAGGHFTNSAAVDIRTYDVSVGGIGTVIASLSSSFNGTLYVSVSTDGQQTHTSGAATPILPTTTSSSSSSSFTASRTGSFNDSTIWVGGQIPSGNCSITIPSGVSVIFSGEILNIQVQTLTIAGAFIVSSTTSFTFQYAINILVQAGGKLNDLSFSHQWYFRAGSICTFHPLSSFTGSGTIVYAYTSLPANASPGDRYTFGSMFSGPFTFAVLSAGQIETFDNVQFIVAASGDFSDASTWFGGMVPTADFCSLVGGCGLYIPTGFSLSTASLNGELDIDFSSITVASGATFDLGTSGLSLGFRFSFSFGFYVYGSLSFSASGGGIYLPFGSAFNFFAGGHFTNSAAVDIRTYDVSVGGIGTVIASLSSSFNGTLYVSVSTDGQQTHTSGAATPILPTTTSSSSSSSFTASRTGSFNDSTIWVGGQIPSGNCSITIPSGVSVVFSGDILNIQVQTLTIAGTLIISSNAGFTFQYAISIVVQDGGKLQDQSVNHKWYLLAGSLCTFFPGASFTGGGTIVSTYTSLPASGSLGASYTFGFGFSGPFTFAVLLSGQIETFANVQFIVAASGDFSDASTWFGGIVPSASFCSLVGGCGLYIPTGFSLSTASLNGELDIDFTYITVASGGTFDLGTSGLSIGFRFLFSFGFDIYGSLSFSATGGGIYLPFGSAFNFFAGGHVTNSAAVDIRTYDVSRGGIGSLIVSLDSSFTNSLHVSVSTDGQQTQTSDAATPILPTTTSSSSITSFTASRTGRFNDSTIWAGGQVPSGNCSITIPSGVTVTFSGEILNIQVQTLTIAGTFIISSTANFTFQYAISIVIESEGKLQDQSADNNWYFLAGSLCTFYPGSSFTGSGTVVYAYRSLPASGSVSGNYRFGSQFAGPFTFAILTSGQIETFSSVQFIVAASSDFSDASTWFGGMVPTASFCSFIGGCGLYIPPGYTLSTASLYGELDIEFISITVASNATFDLGTSGLSLGFRFSFSFGFYVYGSLSFSASGGGIYLPFGSAFNFFAGGHFTNSAAVEIRTYDVSVGGIGTVIASLSSAFNGTLYVSVSTDGQQTHTSGAATPILPTTTSSSSITSFSATRSGNFTDSTTWSGGQVPSGKCSITIPSGVTVTFSGEILNIPVQTLIIAGTFIISSTANFTFQYAISIVVQDGGKLRDQTSNHILYFLAGSLCTFYPGATFIGSGTIVYTYTSLPASGSTNASYTFGSNLSGPFTFAILSSDQIEAFTNVQFIVAASGDFNDASTWFGGIVPTASLCSLVGGCGLYVPTGFSLSTASLNGELNIDFSYITVASGATFDLGTSGLSIGFRFLFSFGFDIYGSLSFSASGGGIYLPFGSAFNFFAGARFRNSAAVEIRTYDVSVGGIGTLVVSLDSTFSSSLYISISIDGQQTQTSEPATPAVSAITNGMSTEHFTGTSDGVVASTFAG